ncbi:hypothetical protein BH23CYA1_BH23CYA1_16010 [soil metagenome]
MNRDRPHGLLRVGAFYGKKPAYRLRKIKRTQDFPVENPCFPVENLWRTGGKLIAVCGKESSYCNACGKTRKFSTGFPQHEKG